MLKFLILEQLKDTQYYHGVRHGRALEKKKLCV